MSAKNSRCGFKTTQSRFVKYIYVIMKNCAEKPPARKMGY